MKMFYEKDANVDLIKNKKKQFSVMEVRVMRMH